MSTDNSTVDPDVQRDDNEGAPSTHLIEDPTTDILSLFLLQVILILIIVRLLAKALAQLRQPAVIGEILAGVVLGPSILGQIPGFESTLFPAFSLATLQIFAQIGLIFFMFFLGLELDPTMFFRYWRSAFPIAVVSVLVPFGLGCSLSPLLYGVEYTSASHSTFTLFMGTSLAFTAFPLLARILTAFRLLDTPFGQHVLSIAAIDDILAWCTLALTLSHSSGASDANGVYTALITIAYLLVLIFVTRPCLLWISRQLRFQQKVPGELNRDYTCVLILCLCASAIWTEISGIHAFFGAFTFGLIVPKDKLPDGSSVVDILAPKIELLIVEFFLPLYFAYSGLRTNLASLNTGAVWGDAILVILVASLGKIIPVTIMTRAMTKWRRIGDDFEQEEMDWEVERQKMEASATAQRGDLKVNGDEGADLEMASVTGKGTDEPSTYSYQTYATPAHKTQGAAHSNGDEEKRHPSDAAPPSPSSPADRPSSSPSSSSPPSSSSFPASSSSSGPRSEAYSWRTCLSVGLLMNTTGLVTLVALNIGYDRGILGPKVFSMMVLMALVTTFMTSPFFHYLFYLPYIFERNEQRETRRKEREIAELRAGRTEADVHASEEQRAQKTAEQDEADQAAADEDGASLSISSHPRKRVVTTTAARITSETPYSMHEPFHHVLNPGKEIRITTLVAPPSILSHSLTPPPHRQQQQQQRRASHSANRMDDGGGVGVGVGLGHPLRSSSSDGELADLRSSDVGSSDSDVYSNKVD